MCSTLELHKKSSQYFLDEVGWGGGLFGRGGSMFQEVGGCMGFQRGVGVI